MLKFTSKISVGLDMTWNAEGNEHMGIFVCGNSRLNRVMKAWKSTRQ